MTFTVKLCENGMWKIDVGVGILLINSKYQNLEPVVRVNKGVVTVRTKDKIV